MPTNALPGPSGESAGGVTFFSLSISSPEYPSSSELPPANANPTSANARRRLALLRLKTVSGNILAIRSESQVPGYPAPTILGSRHSCETDEGGFTLQRAGTRSGDLRTEAGTWLTGQVLWRQSTHPFSCSLLSIETGRVWKGRSPVPRGSPRGGPLRPSLLLPLAAAVLPSSAAYHLQSGQEIFPARPKYFRVVYTKLDPPTKPRDTARPHPRMMYLCFTTGVLCPFRSPLLARAMLGRPLGSSSPVWPVLLVTWGAGRGSTAFLRNLG
jgi:hypothetical protein